MKKWLFILCLLGLIACSSETKEQNLPVNPEAVQPLEVENGSAPIVSEYIETEFSPNTADHFDLVNNALQLNEAELALLRQNGFVVTDRLQWNRFKEAYAWIYWQDLPVLVTTDSILHTVHQSYSDLLMSLEYRLMGPMLEDLLTQSTNAVRSTLSQNQNPALTETYEDVLTYLQVSLALLHGEPGESAEAHHYVQLAENAAGRELVTLFESSQPADFGLGREVDFTLFKPRGHYANSSFHQNYFRAMSWLAHVDFRLVRFDETTNEPKFDPQALAAAVVLKDHLRATGRDKTWRQINELLAVLVGRSDNMTLTDLDRYLIDMQLDSPMSIFEADQEALLQQLLDHDYGQQRITGQIVGRHVGNSTQEPVPRPISFMLLGQRFSIDSYVMSNLVYDRLFVDGVPVERPFPATMDVMYVLGNDHAWSHLQPELQQYGYSANLNSLRSTVDRMPLDFWRNPIYNQWLGLLRSLNQRPDSANFPLAMQTRAWADKILHTQLTSWAQLRHDNILYAKQSFTTVQVLCEYPAGYIEPYPKFYRAVYQFAAESRARLTNLDLSSEQKGSSEFARALSYFNNVMTVMEQLEILVNKELARDPFTVEEESFLKSIVRAQLKETVGCGGKNLEEHWDGWYPNLFYSDDENSAVVADVHTNPNVTKDSPLYPPGVLHVASGPVVPIIMIVNTGEETGMFVGPSMTYYEFVETGHPFIRLNDEEWRERLKNSPYAAPPAWTASFRYSTSEAPQILELPVEKLEIRKPETVETERAQDIEPSNK